MLGEQLALFEIDDSPVVFTSDGYRYGVDVGGFVTETFMGEDQRERSEGEVKRLQAKYPRSDISLVRRARSHRLWTAVP